MHSVVYLGGPEGAEAAAEVLKGVAVMRGR